MLFETIANIIVKNIGCDIDDITMESTFESLNIDSLDTVEMLMELEDELGFEIEPDDKLNTIGDLVAFIEDKQNA